MRIDLLLTTDQGWIVRPQVRFAEQHLNGATLAAGYAGQSAAYSPAIEKVTGIPVLETRLVMPLREPLRK